jgi:hypothetical protein
LVICILNHEDRKDRKEKMLAHLAAEQLDSVMDREEVARHIVDSAAAIHTALGPGLLESIYRRCLMYELGLRGLDVHKVARIKDGIQRMIWHER